MCAIVFEDTQPERGFVVRKPESPAVSLTVAPHLEAAGIKVDPSGAVGVRMTLTSPNCPSAAELPQEVERKVKAIGGVTAATVEVVFEPPWEPSMMSEAAKLQLNML